MHPTPEYVAAVQSERLLDADRERRARLATCCNSQFEALFSRLARALQYRPNGA